LPNFPVAQFRVAHFSGCCFLQSPFFGWFFINAVSTVYRRNFKDVVDLYVLNGNAESAGLDIAGLDTDGRMCGQLTELKLKNFIPLEDFHSNPLTHTRCLFYVVINLLFSDFCNS